MPEFQQAPAAPPAPAAAAQNAQAAEAATIDARLDLAAKKAALRELEAQAAGGDAQAPAAPAGPSKTVITYEANGKTVVLENPTAEQLRALGIGSQKPSTPWSPGEFVPLVSITFGSAIVLLYIVLQFFKSRGGRSVPRDDSAMQARMSRLETAIDSVAMEVEKIGESQRYTSKLLSEGPAARVDVPEIVSAVLQNRGGAK